MIRMNDDRDVQRSEPERPLLAALWYFQCHAQNPDTVSARFALFRFFFFGDWGWAVQPGTRYVTYDTEHSLLACRLLASNKILRLDSDIFEPLTDLVTL